MDTANVYRKTKDELMFQSVISTQWYLQSHQWLMGLRMTDKCLLFLAAE